MPDKSPLIAVASPSPSPPQPAQVRRPSRSLVGKPVAKFRSLWNHDDASNDSVISDSTASGYATSPRSLSVSNGMLAESPPNGAGMASLMGQLNINPQNPSPSPEPYPGEPLTVSVSPSGKGSKAPPRFTVYPDGNHSHYLKATKRQEKISSVLKEILGGNKRRDEAISVAVAQPEKPPSLIGQLATQMQNKNIEAIPSSVMANASFVEKYGKCQGVIGKGAFGIVRVAHKVDLEHQEHLYAVKEFKKKINETDQQYNKRLTSEFCISSSLHHPNVIETLDLLQDSKGEYLEVMEYCAGGDLYSLILAAGKLEYLEADCFFKQIVRAVNYMHEMGVAHRDLKPENILLTVQGSVKITDFGNGECFRMAWEKDVHLSSGVCGSEPYIAPEVFGQEEFDPRAVDIWSVGVIYMAMRNGRHLWRIADSAQDEFYKSYLQGRKDADGYEPIENLKRARCRNVIYSILDPVPARRITGRQIMKSEWGREIRLCEAGEKGL